MNKKEYKNLVHNCALVYNAVPFDVYMKFHANVNASNFIDLEVERLDKAHDVIDLAFNWGFTPESDWYWADLFYKLKAKGL